MRKIALKLIKFYWVRIPPSQRKVCLFSHSCSIAVYEEIEKNGLWKGLILYLFRLRNCRRGYILYLEGSMVNLKTSNGEFLNELEINPVIVKEYKSGISFN